MQYNFGAGNIFATRTDIANATPQQLGTVQDISVDISFGTKELMGQNMFPVDVARTAAKITGKAKQAQIKADLFNTLFFGQTVQALNSNQVSPGEAAMVPAATTYTVTPANAATYAEDLGVVYAATGLALTKVASAPAIGQYSVNSTSGIYTFAAADASAAVLLNYRYTATIGKLLNVSNQLMGTSPIFRLVLAGNYEGKTSTLIINQCKSTKLALDYKNEDYTIPEFDFSAFADAAGNVMSISTAE